MYKFLFSLLVILIQVNAGLAQTKSFIGRYSDDITFLDLKPDSTFSLTSPDLIFPYTYNIYQNQGTWTSANNIIILNPSRQKRIKSVTLVEAILPGTDSIKIKIDYQVETYENELLNRKEPSDFNLLTLYINKPKKYLHLVHQPIIRVCAFSPRVKRQVKLDSTNTVVIAKQAIHQLGVYTYGFEQFITLTPTNPQSNYFEIHITQPVDVERTPRSKMVMIKKNKAFYYERQGKIPTNDSLNPLIKEK